MQLGNLSAVLTPWSTSRSPLHGHTEHSSAPSSAKAVPGIAGAVPRGDNAKPPLTFSLVQGAVHPAIKAAFPHVPLHLALYYTARVRGGPGTFRGFGM